MRNQNQRKIGGKSYGHQIGEKLAGKNSLLRYGQINFDGCSIKDFIFTACILRKKKNGPLYYQAELMDTGCKNSVIIVPLEKVLTKSEV